MVDWTADRQVGNLAVRDVRDAADGVGLRKQVHLKILNWTHGRLKAYVVNKAAAKGIAVELVNEAYTSQTCPNRGERHKTRRGRYVFCCPV